MNTIDDDDEPQSTERTKADHVNHIPASITARTKDRDRAGGEETVVRLSEHLDGVTEGMVGNLEMV